MSMKTSPTEHLAAEDLFYFIEDGLSRRHRERVQAHLDGCAACRESLAMVVASDRPSSREEEEALAGLPVPDLDGALERLRPAIASSRPTAGVGLFDWRTLAGIAAAAALFAILGWSVVALYMRPADSRRMAASALAALVELRQGAGALPLRYIEGFYRAEVTRSGFDSTAPTEQLILAELEEAVALSPEPESMLALGLFYIDTSKPRLAQEWLQRVLEAEPESAKALNGMAVSYYLLAEQEPERAYNHQQKGLALLREAQGFDRNDPQIMFNFGRFYEALDLPGPAAQAWERYLQMDSSSEWADAAAFQLGQVAPR